MCLHEVLRGRRRGRAARAGRRRACGAAAGVLLAALGAGAAERARVYTNDDLARVAPLRDQTGVASVPAFPPAGEPLRAEPPLPARGEAYWRREAERLRDRLWPLHERARELRQRIAERRRAPRVRPYTDPQVLAWQRRLAALEERIRELESRFEERARRAGALPGWIR